jgi:hypothetical protein
VRGKIPCHSVQINLCAQFPIPCANKSFRAAIFPFVRAKFNPCAQLAVPCEPTSLPCGHKSICAAIFQSVLKKGRFSMVFDEFKWSKSDSFALFARPQQRRRREIFVVCRP